MTEIGVFNPTLNGENRPTLTIVESTGKNELLAPRIENQNNQFTKAVLFAKVPFELTSKEDRMRTCYMQACLAYVNFEGISNADIRKIFGLGEKEKSKASRIIANAVDSGYIKVMDPDTDKVIKEIPPVALQKLQIRIKEALGLLFDEKV